MNIRPENRHERQTFAALQDGLAPTGDSQKHRVTLIVVTLFWVAQFGANTLFTQLNSPEAAMATLLPRALVCVAGELITLACIALQERSHNLRLLIRAYWAIAFTIFSALLLGALNHLIFGQFLGSAGVGTSGFWLNLPGLVIPRLWVFGSVYAMSLAISYSTDVHEREEEIATLRALAQDAQLRALRSQLNPHFLFNALNSIAALINEGRPEPAEKTTENLADFLRITLSLEPQRLITLEEELALQRLYLDIQKVRFPTRLSISMDVAAEVEGALVPNLILQPLVENSIKYAVTQSVAPVTIQVSADMEGDRLRLVVEDDGGNAASPDFTKGNRMGLSNVTQRLSAHFGDGATLTAGPRSGGGFRNVIIIPLRRAS